MKKFQHGVQSQRLNKPVLLGVIVSFVLCSFLVNPKIDHPVVKTKDTEAGLGITGAYGGHPRQLLWEDPNLTDCVPAAIEQFPPDFFNQQQRQKGGVLIHVVFMIYICATLALVCDSYFVPALEIISDRFHVSSDLAGATFMAIGTSAPELFTSILGVFVTGGDIGTGTIIGSAIFNLLGVTSLVGMAVWKTGVDILWYPVSRDCLMYIVSVAALTFVIYDGIVFWWEALGFLLLFLVYVFILTHNSKIETFCTEKMEQWQADWKAYRLQKLLKSTPGGLTERSPLVVKKPDSVDSGCPTPDSVTSSSSFEISISDASSHKGGEEADSDTGDISSPWKMPSYWSQRIQWVVMWPALFLIFLTVPDCRRPFFKKWFPVTFAMSITWIGALTYMCIWMVTVIGYTLGIPDNVSGLTLLAAGTSMPEVISSIIVVKNGFGEMALCNLIASNVFDILVCLGLPWLINSSFLTGSGSMEISSHAMSMTVLTLLSMVVLFLLALLVVGWRLDWKIGVISFVMYASFITLSCLYEMNVLGEFGTPVCPPS